jgi:hypothetical protein
LEISGSALARRLWNVPDWRSLSASGERLDDGKALTAVIFLSGSVDLSMGGE